MKNLDDFFQRRSRVMLAFSAGKDSAACLRLLEPWWDKLHVVWCNMGNPYEETLEYMISVAKLVPNFWVVTGNQPASIVARGYPVDVLPLWATEKGKLIEGMPGPLLRPFWECCEENHWRPMDSFRKNGGYDGLIRGQKAADALKAPIVSGTVVDGTEYLFPLEKWSDSEVRNFAGEALPESYGKGRQTSLDCKNCTAYARENRNAVQYLRQAGESEAADEVEAVHKYLQAELQHYSKLLGGPHGS